LKRENHEYERSVWKRKSKGSWELGYFFCLPSAAKNVEDVQM
jgi:hypothetical protein